MNTYELINCWVTQSPTFDLTYYYKQMIRFTQAQSCEDRKYVSVISSLVVFGLDDVFSIDPEYSLLIHIGSIFYFFRSKIK